MLWSDAYKEFQELSVEFSTVFDEGRRGKIGDSRGLGAARAAAHFAAPL